MNVYLLICVEHHNIVKIKGLIMKSSKLMKETPRQIKGINRKKCTII